MFCPNCGSQNRDQVNFCENCGASLRGAAQSPRRSTPTPIQPIIVQAQGARGGLFSGCAGIINWLLALLVLGLIAMMALSFLCILRLPASFPLIDPPAPLQDLWSRAVAWQGQNCESRVQPVQRSAPGQSQPQQPAQPSQQDQPAQPADQPAQDNPPETKKEATVFVDPMVGEKCSMFIINFSGFSPREIIYWEISNLDNPALYTFRDQITSDENGNSASAWNGDTAYPGQYLIRAWTDYEEGSAVIIVEGDNTASCDCLKADTEAQCVSNGGAWQVLRMQTGPNQYFCSCPNQ
jgi:hypothetical protein